MPLIKLSLMAIDDQSAWRGREYAEAVMASGTVNDATVEIDYADFQAILARFPPKEGLGDKLERLAKPIAKFLKLPCLDERGELKRESGCAKRRDGLNALH